MVLEDWEEHCELRYERELYTVAVSWWATKFGVEKGVVRGDFSSEDELWKEYVRL